MNPRRTIVPLIFIAAGITVAGRLAHGEAPRPRIIVGALIVAVMLTAISDVAPGLGTGFAVVIFLTALLTAGPDVVSRFNPTSASLDKTRRAASEPLSKIRKANS